MALGKFHSSSDVRDSIESLYRLHGEGRPIIYWILLLVTMGAVVCLPLVKVDMSVGAPGQVRPTLARLSVFPAVAGKINELLVRDNQAVRTGDVLLAIDSSALDARLAQTANESSENERALSDLSLLLASDTLAALSGDDSSDECFAAIGNRAFTQQLPEQLHTSQYVRQHALLLSDLRRLLFQRNKAVHDLDRGRELHRKGLISDLDIDQQHYTAELVERDIELTVQQTLSRWQSDRIERELRQVQLESETKQLQQQKELYTLKAPINGTAMGFEGLYPGLFLPSSQRIGEISPQGGLQAEVYISPRDIGFVRMGQAVKVQVDAFPYTEWGMLQGTVSDISNDFIQVGQDIAFKAVIELERTQLISSKGVAVDLRRGMTVNARFILKERTLFDILYNKLSDSLDPEAKSIVN